MNELLISPLCLLIGIIFGIFIGKKFHSKSGEVEKENYDKILKQLNDTASKKTGLESDVLNLKNQLTEIKDEKDRLYDKLIDLERYKSSSETEKINLHEKIENYKIEISQIQNDFKKQVEESQNKMKIEFENLANKIFDEKSNTFKNSSKENLENILNPLKTQIDSFKKDINDKYSNEEKERFSLKREIENLTNLNKAITEETQNLTTALRSEVKKQGGWGEIKLELLLERSGLEKGKEYITQGKGMGLKSESGGTALPDVIVHLPENKHIIVDSKVSLKAYLDFIDGESPETKNQSLDSLFNSIKNHIDGLSGKRYEFNEKLFTPEFTFIFFPLEGALSLVIDMEVPRLGQSLMQYAWEKSIVIVTPTTLMATLRTVASIWRFDKQEKNALEIALQGGKLYDKFVGFVGDLENIKKNIDNTGASYDEAMKKLKTGRGNLIDQVERMKTLGAKAKKSLPDDIVETARIEAGTEEEVVE